MIMISGCLLKDRSYHEDHVGPLRFEVFNPKIDVSNKERRHTQQIQEIERDIHISSQEDDIPLARLWYHDQLITTDGGAESNVIDTDTPGIDSDQGKDDNEDEIMVMEDSANDDSPWSPSNGLTQEDPHDSLLSWAMMQNLQTFSNCSLHKRHWIK